VWLYRVCDDLSGALIYSMVVFGPWAFGTTQPWSVQLMNGAGYVAGSLLACKLAIRRFKGTIRIGMTTDRRTTPPVLGC